MAATVLADLNALGMVCGGAYVAREIPRFLIVKKGKLRQPQIDDVRITNKLRKATGAATKSDSSSDDLLFYADLFDSDLIE